MKLLEGLLVVAKVPLAADKDDWKVGAEMQNLRNPLNTCKQDVFILELGLLLK